MKNAQRYRLEYKLIPHLYINLRGRGPEERDWRDTELVGRY